MEFISRVSLRRHEMGEAGEDTPAHSRCQCLIIFRVRGKSPERALKLLPSEIAKETDRIVVLAIAGKTLSEDEKRICDVVMAECLRRSIKTVFCGGDPAQIFGKPPVASDAAPWFPNIPAFISTLEIGGGRQTANRTR
jgi:hypothetical protein